MKPNKKTSLVLAKERIQELENLNATLKQELRAIEGRALAYKDCYEKVISMLERRIR